MPVPIPHEMTSSEKELLDLIKNTNPGTAGDLTYENVIFSPAEAVVGRVDGRDSMVHVSGVPELGIAENPRTVYYWRVDLGVLFSKINASVGMAIVDGLTTHDLVPVINAKYGTTMTIDDVELTPLVIDPLPGTAVIKAVDGNAKYVGEFTVAFDNSSLNLSDVIVVDTLMGFNYPNSDITKGQATLYSYSLEAPEESEAFWSTLPVDAPLPVVAEDHVNSLYGLDNSEIWLVDAGVPADFNLDGSILRYTGENDPVAIQALLGINTNPIFANVAIFELGANCQNFGGYFIVGWGTAP